MRYLWVPLCLVAGVAAVIARGGDWPQWGGAAGRNMASGERGLPVDFRPGAKLPGGHVDANSLRNVQWVVQLGTQSFSSPVVAGGKVFLGTNDGHGSDARAARTGGGLLICADEKTGKLLWRLLVPRYRRKVHGSGFDDFGAGICSTPTVEAGRVYLVSNRGEVLCLDANGQADGNDGPFRDEGRCLAADGNEPVTLHPGDADILWRVDMIGELPCAPHDVTNCSVLIHGECLYVCTSNGVHRCPTQPNPLPEAPSLIVLSKTTGRLLAVDEEKIGRRVFHGQWSSPSLGEVDGRTLVFFGAGDGVCYAFEAVEPDVGAAEPAAAPRPLRKVWSFDCNPPDRKSDANGPIDYWAGDAARATVPKDFQGPSEIIATPVFHRGRVYLAVGRDPEHGRGPGILHCIDATKTGDVSRSAAVWSYRRINRSLSTVAVAGGLVYAADLAGTVHCLDANTGQVQWVHTTGQAVWSSPFVADGKVYVGTRAKRLWIFRAGRHKEVLAEVRFPHAIAATPIAANGVLYVASDRFLYALRRGAASR